MHQSFSTSLALQVASRRWRRCVLQDRVSLFFGLPSFCFLFCFLVALANEFTPRPGLWPRPVLGGFGGRCQESVGVRNTFGPDRTPAAAHPKPCTDQAHRAPMISPNSGSRRAQGLHGFAKLRVRMVSPNSGSPWFRQAQGLQGFTKLRVYMASPNSGPRQTQGLHGFATLRVSMVSPNSGSP